MERLETKVAVAGAVIKLNCILDANCTIQSFRWTHSSAFKSKSGTWFNGLKLSSMPVMRGVNVDKDTANGRSVLTIPRARLEDSGRFHCIGSQDCQINFQLIVTGNICILSGYTAKLTVSFSG